MSKTTARTVLISGVLMANNVPKPTTIAWPLHAANRQAFPELAASGYIFARGGHNRPYRPTVDNPFEIPSMWCYGLEDFVRMVQPSAVARVGMPLDSSRPNVFTWCNAESGNWSDGSKWSNTIAVGSAPASAGQSDYVLNFKQRGACAVTNDLNTGFLLSQLILGDGCGGMLLDGNSLTFARSRAHGFPPAIHADKCQRVDINVPINLQDDLRRGSPTRRHLRRGQRIYIHKGDRDTASSRPSERRVKIQKGLETGGISNNPARNFQCPNGMPSTICAGIAKGFVKSLRSSPLGNWI